MSSRFSKTFLISASILIVVFLVFQPIYSANAAGLVPCGRSQDDPTTPENETRKCETCDLLVLGSTIINFILFTITPAVAVLLYLIAGFMIILGGANPRQVTTGRNIFKTTTYGLFIVFGAWMIANTVLKSLAGDGKFTKKWYEVTCENSTGQAPTGTPVGGTGGGGGGLGGGGEFGGGGASGDWGACMFNGVDYAKFNLCTGQARPGGCGTSLCSQYVPSIERYADGAATAALLKTVMVIESDCKIGAATGSSYGLMQIQPGTANMFRNRCSITELVTSSWLTNPANADKSICLGAAYINSIAGGACGAQPRKIYAGYNAGPGNCADSIDCSNVQSCDKGVMQKWECPFDNPQQTVCNTRFYQTKQGSTYVNYCLDNLGF